MTIISIIAAIDEDGGLGIDNQLLCHLPADLQHFKNITIGKPIIMGRKTFESIGKPLPGRLNVVLSHSPFPIAGVTLVDSLDKAFALTSEEHEVMLIGGANLFSQVLPNAKRMYITKIHHKFKADVFFPEFSQTEWRCQNLEFRQRDEKNKYDMTFITYERT